MAVHDTVTAVPDMIAYINALIDNALAQVPATDPDPKTLERPLPFYQGAVKTHIRLLEDTRQVLHTMSEDIKVKYRAEPMLFHPDLHKRNIFISDDDPTNITAFINWHSASIEPAFWYTGTTPDFVKSQSLEAVRVGPTSTDSSESAAELEIMTQSSKTPDETKSNPSQSPAI
ncbi:hypothetical protein N7520_010342 [Penicillium odoratum]|uniref:uncharacterized protein n=1 Tax=Penicillium odoratum TaxID=1167516 RepID=UPI002549ACDB|nr:uncharacterized protein N7520_010342 [Penicillium odoratum]KAJ5745160.1 hypothetical protein N7520_010342 [Penicillium odoratum]